MNILGFTSLYPNNVCPNHGIFVKERLTRIAALPGVHVQIVSPVPYYPPIGFGWRMSYRRVQKREFVDGIEVYHPRYIMAPKIGMAIHGFLMALCSLPLVRRICREFPPDIVDAHFVYPDGFAGMLIGQYLGCPVVVTARGSDVNVCADLPIIRSLLRLTLSRATYVISVSNPLAAKIGQLGISQKKIRVIPNGVDSETFYPSSKAEARKSISFEGNQKLVLSVGNYTSNKGMDLLVQALAYLRDSEGLDSLPILVLIGEGKEGLSLESLVINLKLTHNVRVMGPVPHYLLPKWYRSADLFCLASSREGCPNVILESLACGTPVVATRVGGIPDLVNSPDVGILTDRSPEAMAKAIIEALNKVWDADLISQHVHRRTWEHVAGQEYDVFKSAVG